MLIEANRSVLVVIDVQERLTPAMDGLAPLKRNLTTLMRAAARLDVPMIVTEQYPKGLGRTVADLAALAPAEAVVEKIEFSAARNDAFNERLAALGRSDPIICGIEAHVCVLQTTLDLAERGLITWLVGDATASRVPASAAAAHARAGRHGVELVTTEMVLFEWLRRAGTPLFRELSALIR
ncbi:MAG: isochorismatase family protein [Inquilinus sp.]|nr:isochorismatase family protein [Inquilinus sp.]